MAVRLLRADSDNYQAVFPVSQEGWDRLQLFDGSPVPKPWLPLRVQLFKGEPRGKALEVGDFPSLATHVPVFSASAVQALAGVLDSSGELLPLDCPEGTYYAFNVTRVLDVLDSTRAEVLYFKSSGRVRRVGRYAFREAECRDELIFKIPQVPLMDVFVTEHFVGLVGKAGLRGLAFVDTATL